MKTGKEQKNEAWINFLRRHSQMSLLLVALILGASAAAILVFLSVVAGTQAAGIVPSLLGQWTVGYFITFILNAIFWELVLVGSWLIPAVLIIYGLWYKQLPEKERQEYEGRKRKRKSAEDGGFSFVVGLVWLLFVWIGGKWNLAFQSWAVNDYVYSWLAACLSVLLVVGILGLMYVIWSLTRNIPEKKKGK